jgi:hypothetical protein
MLARYYTADQIATVLGVDRKRVFDWKRAGLIAPVLTKGEEQYCRADVLRLAVLLALKDVFGDKHGAPAKLVDVNAETFDLYAAQITGSWPDFGPVVLHAPESDVELRVTIADAIRERLAQVPA